MANTNTQLCKSILIVEDNADIRESLVDVLRMEGYLVESAANGSEAIEKLQTVERPPLILLDMMMPVMNGWQFLEAQKQDAQFAGIPVVLVSAVKAEQSLISDQGSIQAMGHLQKPIDIDSLLKVVEVYCEPPSERASA